MIEPADDLFVAPCPEIGVASRGATVEEARDNLVEAIELFFESASPEDTKQRLRSEVLVTQVEVRVAYAFQAIARRRPDDAQSRRYRLISVW